MVIIILKAMIVCHCYSHLYINTTGHCCDLVLQLEYMVRVPEREDRVQSLGFRVPECEDSKRFSKPYSNYASGKCKHAFPRIYSYDPTALEFQIRETPKPCITIKETCCTDCIWNLQRRLHGSNGNRSNTSIGALHCRANKNAVRLIPHSHLKIIFLTPF